MRVLGNILWFIFGGLAMGLAFALEGLACFLTLIGIPFGLQWFKMVPLVFVPFGKGIRYPKVTGMKVFGNVLWVILVGWWNALACLLWGVLCCITIIGIPFGKQWFKLARLLFLPFGAEVYNEVEEKKEQQGHERMVTSAATAAATAVAAQYGNPALPNAYASQPVGAVRGNWTCPNCGKPDNSADSVFCDSCGNKRAERQESGLAKSGPLIVAVMSAVSVFWGLMGCLISGSLFLSYLFAISALFAIVTAIISIMSINKIREMAKLSAVDQQYNTIPAAETPEQNTEYTPSEAPIIENNTWTCPNCGKTDNPPYGKFCNKCGTGRPPQSPPEESAETPIIESNTWTCPNCGKIDNPTDCAFCGGCGQKRVVENKSWACPSYGKTDNPTECNFCGNCGAKRPSQPLS